ncbi:hypothetical protein [Caenispirillum bisanense]|uniref:phosphorylase family protein n=1 Tax=Caenispirillum bisanense TaxID=414052 RepID=UPI0031D667D0
MPARLGIGVVTGTQADAALARALGLRVASCGGIAGRAEDLAEELVDEQGVVALVSFGLAAGLSPALPAAAVLVASGVMPEQGGRPLVTDDVWRTNLLRSLPQALTGLVLGVERPLLSAAEKGELFAATTAVAADAESLGVAEVAARRALPCVVLRAICDPADADMPPAAFAALLRQGEPSLTAALRRPRDLPALMRTVRQVRQARAALAAALPVLADCLPHRAVRAAPP